MRNVELDRIRLVVSRIKNWYGWCAEWTILRKQKCIISENRFMMPDLMYSLLTAARQRFPCSFFIPDRTDGKKHGDYFMDWASGEEELRFYPDGEHVCANYKDETIPYIIDWLNKHLA